VKDKPLRIRLEHDTNRRLSAKAAAIGIGVSTLARYAIEELLKQHPTSASLLEAYLRSRAGTTLAEVTTEKAA
jgi:hypothetical protein